ncbi:YIP1 family protein [Paenibacillus sp. GCM10027626]|uniref:YIP1 family protein n=1 Tax=Paenibacillus sp. GCM10027626 TaxID=3273411 RepID=UPI0036373D64
MRKYMLLFPLLLMLTGTAAPVFSAPYEGYNYSWWGDPEPAPAPYLPVRQIDGEELSIGSFKTPEDFAISESGDIYILDTGNNRIVCLDSNLNVNRVIDSFINQGKPDGFAAPQGIFIHRNGHLYVADTGHKRVIELTPEGQLIREIGAPEADVLSEGFNYQPSKLVVDSADRMYVVGKGVFEGIMQFDSGGKFTGFMGVNRVTFSPIDLFWKQVMTKEQRSKMVLFIPVDFTNVAIDNEGFIFATSSDSYSDDPVKRLNPSGIDVLRRAGYFHPKGDITFTLSGTRPGTSSIVDVAIDRNGIYHILDSRRGRVFTYDREGKLMYIFGQLGEQVGNFKTPVALDMLGDRVVVLDKGFNHLVIFEPTRYGQVIRNAVIYNDIGQEGESVAAWRDALTLNSNLEIAYLGIGKAELRRGNNDAAMENFRLGMHRPYYSRAFERYRKEFMWEHFDKIATAGLIGLAGLVIVVRKARKKEEPGVIGMAWYTMFHPFKGFWELKYEKKAKVWFTLLLLLLLSLLYVLKRQYTGFIFNPHAAQSVNTWDEVKFIVLPFFLWCVANWSLTTLMDGEGKFKEIVMATGYALVPLVLVQLPLIALSNVITLQEGAFYTMLETVAFLWCIGLIFVGMLTVHQYSVAKTIVTMLLTIIVIGIFVFLGLLFFSLVQQMLSFLTTVYKEIMFRIGEG